MNRGTRVGRLFGIDIVIDLSLWILAAMLVAALFLDFRRRAPEVANDVTLAVAAAGGALFFASVLAHELSHSIPAQRRGLVVERIRLFFFGGVSEITGEVRTPRDELVVSVAGPLASAALGAAFLTMSVVVPGTLPARTAYLLGMVNLLLAAFNMLPGYPLDGGRALRALLWTRGTRERATSLAIGVGRSLGIALVVLGAYLMVSSPGLGGVWVLLVGWFLHRAAVAGRDHEALLARLEATTAGQVMRPVDAAVDTRSTVAAAIAAHGEALAMPVEAAGRVVGFLGPAEVARVDETGEPAAQVGDAMMRIGPSDVVGTDRNLRSVLESRPDSGRPLVVVHGGRVVGIITSADVAELVDRLR